MQLTHLINQKLRDHVTQEASDLPRLMLCILSEWFLCEV